MAGTAVIGITGIRWRNVEVERIALNREYERIANEIAELQGNRVHHTEAVSAKEKWAANMTETMQSIWSDRFDRYKMKLEDLKSYIVALPESLGVLQGVQYHYDYLSKEMPQFLTFDVAAATVHNFGLLLSQAENVGVASVSSTLRHLMGFDDFVDAVCTNVEGTQHVEVPRNIEEASRTFTFCMEQLDEARDEVVERYGGVSIIKPAFVDEVQERRKGSLLLDGLRMGLRKLRVGTLTAHQKEVEKRRKAIEALFKNERQHLQTDEDVRAAMDHVATIKHLLRSEDSHATASPSSQSHSSRNAIEEGMPPQLVLAIQCDHGVQLALQQAELWRNAAGTLMLQRQAQEALRSYHILLSEALSRVYPQPIASK